MSRRQFGERGEDTGRGSRRRSGGGTRTRGVDMAGREPTGGMNSTYHEMQPTDSYNTDASTGRRDGGHERSRYTDSYDRERRGDVDGYDHHGHRSGRSTNER